MSTCEISKAPVSKFVMAGVMGGAAGGVVFGMMMAMMGKLAMIASMIGSQSAIVGFIIHMMISLLFGAIGGLGLSKVPSCMGITMGYGIIFGVALWVVGPLVAMPIMMHMPMFMVDQAAMMSLMGHLIYGVITVLVARFVTRKCNTAK